MAHTAQVLPPKMAAKFAQDAKDGKATRQIGKVFEFDQGSNVVVLISLDPPIGHIMRKKG